ncbi:MAG TPA: peptide ABC transporter substrate-binding protein [Thermomicrobiales bacterium]|nr:peptide ABC transporter substrate-binding protein [Thermomicrobiales bacterium]
MDGNWLTIEDLRDAVLAGRLGRRQLLKRAMALGLSAPVIAGLLAACGGDDNGEATATTASGASATTPAAATATSAETSAATATTGATPAEAAPATGTSGATATSGTIAGAGRGAGDTLRILNWQAPTNLNPHFSQGYHNSAPAQMVLEPLLIVDEAGDMVPILLEEAPSLENGGVAADGLTVTFTLLEGLVWSDGTPFTSEDARFTWQWVMTPGSQATSIATFEPIKDVEVVDERTFIVHYSEPDPAWYNVFSRGPGLGGQILPKHLMGDKMGEAGVNAEFNMKPIGTGPYKITEFRPGDVVVYEINESYREADKPFFKHVEFKGGGDAPAAARAVLSTGEADYAPNLQVETQLLQQMESQGIGKLVSVFAGTVEQILVNFADPNTEVDGARSEPSTTHPFLSDLAVRQALVLGCDRESVATQLYGPTGQVTANVIAAPANFVSPNTSVTFDPDAGAAKLEEAGWTGSPRTKDGVKIEILYQTSINQLRQKTQEIIKQSWEQMGVSVQLKSIDAAVYFSADAGNPDTWSHFYADVEMAAITTNPFPQPLMRYWLSADPAVDIPQKSNSWTGRDLTRWQNQEFNGLYEQVRTELDPAKQAELFIAMNDLIVNDVATIPLVHRATPAGQSIKLVGNKPSPWTEFTWDIANWQMGG